MTIGWVGRSIGLPWMISFSDQNVVSPVGEVFRKLIPIANPSRARSPGREDSGTVAAPARRRGPRDDSTRGDNRVAMDEAHLEQVERWRAHRLAHLQSADGWLAVVGLAWLRQGENSVGADPSNAVALPAGGAPARVGSIEVQGERAILHPDPAAG